MPKTKISQKWQKMTEIPAKIPEILKKPRKYKKPAPPQNIGKKYRQKIPAITLTVSLSL